MVKQGKFEANVQVGGISVPELGGYEDDSSRTNIFMDLRTPVSRQEEVIESDPFGESFTQSWPVTPYTVFAQNHSSAAAWAEVWVDGNKAAMVLVKPGSSETIKGFNSEAGETREFLFSLPRRLRAGEEIKAQVTQEQKDSLCTIQVR